jgi:hypothetical protein
VTVLAASVTPARVDPDQEADGEPVVSEDEAEVVASSGDAPAADATEV